MKTKDLILTALFAALTAVGDFLRVPTPISSFTLQVFFCCLAGVLLGPKYGALSQLVYILLGLAGLPIFTTGGGLGVLVRPTAGFILGLVPLAAVSGALARRWGGGFWSICAACLVGEVLFYAIGLPYMHLVLTLYLQKQQTVWQTVWGGMLIFLPWDCLKIVACGLVGKRLLPLRQREAAQQRNQDGQHSRRAEDGQKD